VRAGKPIYGTEFLSPNFSQIAVAYGLAAARVQNESAYTDALTAALASGRPMLIEVMLDPISYPTTPPSS